MALTQQAFYDVSFSFVDRDRNRSNTSIRLLSSLNISAATTAAQAIGTRLAAISDAVLDVMNITLGFADPDIGFADAPETADVERKGVFVFTDATGTQKVTVQVPSIKNTLVVDGTNVINPADAAVIALVDAFINTALGAGNSPVTVAGVDLTKQLGTGKKTHRASSKG